MSNVNLPFSLLKLLPLILSLQAVIRTLSQSLLQSPSHRKVSLGNFLLQAEPSQLHKYYRWAMSLGVLALGEELCTTGAGVKVVLFKAWPLNENP